LAIASALEARLDAKYQGMLREARMEDARMRDQLSTISTVLQDILATLGLGIAGMSFFGYKKFTTVFRKLKKVHKEFTELVESHRPELDNLIVNKLRKQAERYGGHLRKDFPLPSLEDRSLMALRPKMEREQAISYENFDSLVLLTDRIGAFENDTRAADHFLLLAGYWLMTGQWLQVIARAKRAIDLRPDSAEAALHYGICLCHQAATENDARSRQLLLREAAGKLGLAEDLGGLRAETLFRRGWVEEQRGEQTEAIRLYRASLALEERKPARLSTTCRLACSLAQLDNHRQALLELAPVVPAEVHACWVTDEPAFRESISSPDFCARLEAEGAGEGECA